MRMALAGSIAVMAGWAAAPAYSQQIAEVSPASAGIGAALPIASGITGEPLPLTSCEALRVPCAGAVPTDWDLAELRVGSAVSGMTDLANGRFSLSSVDGGIEPVSDVAGLPVRSQSMDMVDVTAPAMAEAMPRRWSDHVPRQYATHRTFWQQTKSVRTEMLLFLGYFSLQSGKKLFRPTTHFHFHKEGWFGKNTTNLGIDKLTHAYDTYLIAEILHMQMHKNANASEGDALTAAVLASGLMALNELSDGIEHDSGYSMEDITMNLVGAGFSLLRNTVPGLKEKVAFKIEIVPNSSIYSYRGQRHYEQQRFMFSLMGAGFEELKKTPLRYLDLQVGYYGSDFRAVDRNAGKEPKRHLFVGVGLNLGELLFGESRSRLGKAGYTVLDYFQVPYTSVRYDTTGRFGI